MMLLQESDGTVTFDPVFIERNPPLYEKLFVLYLLFMLLVLAARVVQLFWHLTDLRRFQREGEVQRFRSLWLAAHARADSLRRFAVLTFLFTFAISSFAAAQILAQVSTMKTPSLTWVSRDAADLLYAGAAGLVVCAALYAAGFFFQARLVRRELSLARESESNSSDSTSA